MSNVIASRVPQEHASRLKEGARVPLFYLPATSDGQSGPATLRSKYNMVLVFVDAGAEGAEYLSSLAGAYPDILYAQARVIAIAPFSVDEARTLASTLRLPFT